MVLLSEIEWQGKSVEPILRELIANTDKWKNDNNCVFPQDSNSMSLIIQTSRSENFTPLTRYSALRYFPAKLFLEFSKVCSKNTYKASSKIKLSTF